MVRLLVFLPFFWALPVFADSRLDCARLAADPSDPAQQAGGVPYDDIDALQAVKICEAALRQAPGDAQTQFHLARSYAANERFDEAIELLGEALEAEYPAAAAMLASFYLDLTVSTFDRIEDIERALVLMDIAKEGGYKIDADIEFSAWQEYYELAFVSEDYRHPDLMAAVWEGSVAPSTTEDHVSLLVFIENYEELCIEGADANIANSLPLQFLTEVQAAIQNEGSIRSENRTFLNLTLDANKAAYANAAALAIRNDAHDAFLFIDRHECSSEISDQFMENAYGRLHEILDDNAMRKDLALGLFSLALYFIEVHGEQIPEYHDYLSDFFKLR